jgi:hypothetical protein
MRIEFTMSGHAVTTTLTEWSCGCGHHGVFITLAQREAFTECPHGRLERMRAAAQGAVPVDWRAVRRASAKSASERNELEQALVDAFAS